VSLLRDLMQFKNEHRQTYIQVRDFYNSMINAETVPAEVSIFLEDWRMARQNRTMTDIKSWNGLLALYHAAQQAITDQVAQWQQEIRQGLADLETKLPEQLQRASVPAEN